VRDLADEIVVVDTGSTDATAALAREQGARVVASPWNDDFAAARNRSIAEATGEWVLVLDADERLFPRHFEAVRRLIANTRARALQIFVRHYTDDSTLMNWQPMDPAQAESRGFCGCFDSPQVRLFRRRPEIRFEGIVHETVVPSLERHALPTYRADVLIHHYKECRPAERKRARNLLIFELSRRRTESESRDADVWRQRAMAALDVGENTDAVTALERAIELAPDRRDLHYQLGAVLILIGQAERACVRHRRALERFPDEPELVQSLGDACLAAGRLGDASEAYARSLELDPYLYRAVVGLGAIAMQEGRTDAAVRYFEQAKSIHPGLDIPYVNTGLIYLNLGRLDDALAELRRAFAANPKRWQSLAAIGTILFATGQYAESREWYLKAAAADRCAPEVFVKLSASCAALGLHDEARTWAEKAGAANPAYARIQPLICAPPAQRNGRDRSSGCVE
jgi:tetratricopeptide (TPR) repeat protein